MAKLSKTWDMMLGSHLDAHIMGKIYHRLYYPCLVIKCALYLGGYEFLMQNCWYFFSRFHRLHTNLNQYFTIDEAGDKICIFGFSRGAYTARALAGM